MPHETIFFLFQKLSPQEIARRILEYLPPNDIIAETSIAGPG